VALVKFADGRVLRAVNREVALLGVGGGLSRAGLAALRPGGIHFGVVVAVECEGDDPLALISWLVDTGGDARRVIHMQAPARLLAALPDVEVEDAKVAHVATLAREFLEREGFRLDAEAEIARLIDSR
jgi:hypothetical protein